MTHQSTVPATKAAGADDRPLRRQAAEVRQPTGDIAATAVPMIDGDAAPGTLLPSGLKTATIAAKHRARPVYPQRGTGHLYALAVSTAPGTWPTTTSAPSRTPHKPTP